MEPNPLADAAFAEYLEVSKRLIMCQAELAQARAEIERLKNDASEKAKTAAK